MKFLTNLLGRMTDLNPVTLKELRQLVRSKIILWAMVAFPVLLLVVNALVVAASLPHGEAGKLPAELAYEALTVTAGPGILTATLILLGLVTLIVLPLLTGFRLAMETGRSRMDLQFVTALSAEDVIGGKLMATFILALTFTALALPFLTLAYLMRGLDLVTVAWSVLVVILGAVVSTGIGVTIGSLRMPIGVRLTILFFLYIGEGLWSALMTLIALVDKAYGRSSAADPSSLVILGSAAVGTVVALLIARATAASNLKPAYTDYKRGLRRLEAAFLALACLAAPALAALGGDARCGYIPLVFGYLFTLIGALALFLSSKMPRVAAARAPRSFLGRLVTFPFCTTAASGTLFSLLGVAAAMLSIGAVRALTDNTAFASRAAFEGLLAFYGEVMLFTLALALVFRACHAGSRLCAFGPLLIALLFVALMIVGGVLDASDVIDEGGRLPGALWGIFKDARTRDGHVVYGLVGLVVLLVYLAVDGLRTFRRYRRPEVEAK